MREALTLLKGFLPWILFGLVSGPTPLRLQVAVIMSLMATVGFGFKQLRQGFILTWGTLLFFLGNLPLVVFWPNPWIMRHMDVLAHLTLAAIAWGSLFLGRPFVEQYAREQVPEKHRKSPLFIHSCRVITVVWGILFLCSLGVSVYKGLHPGEAGEKIYPFISLAIVSGGIAFTLRYSHRVRKARAERGEV